MELTGPQYVAAADRRFFLHQIAGILECMLESMHGKERCNRGQGTIHSAD